MRHTSAEVELSLLIGPDFLLLDEVVTHPPVKQDAG
jgi:hypothetical protein